MKIKLTQNKVTLIDDADYELIKQYKWCAGRTHQCWYAITQARNDDGKRTTLYMHRLIIGNNCKDLFIDHINGDGLDNRRSNLRICTNAENLHNRLPRREMYKGVYWCKRKKPWRARIRNNGRLIHLGYYDSKEKAANAYNKAARNYFGGFAFLNQIGIDLC